MLLPIKNNKEIIEYKKLLTKHIKTEEKLLTIFEKEEIDISNLIDIVKEIQNVKEISKKILNMPEKKFNEKTDITLIKERDLDINFLNSYKEVSDEISLIEKVLKKDEIPTLNISKISYFLNNFEENLLNIFNEKKEYNFEGKIVILTSKNDSLPLILKNGKKILLSPSNFDLSLFTYDELIEILRILDIVISDNKYDFLRSQIAKHIVSISSISNLI